MDGLRKAPPRSVAARASTGLSRAGANARRPLAQEGMRNAGSFSLRPWDSWERNAFPH